MSELLPPNSTATERALAEAMGQIDALDVPVRSVWNADTIPAPLLPWLAWAWSVDEWDATWQTGQKRETVKRALAVQRKKGTIGAVKDALAALGIFVEVREWFQQTPPGDPYTFTLYVEANQTPVSLEGIRTVTGVVNASKNLRSHLAEIRVRARTEARVYVGVVAGLGSELTLTNFVRDVDQPLIAASAQLDQIVNQALPAALEQYA